VRIEKDGAQTTAQVLLGVEGESAARIRLEAREATA